MWEPSAHALDRSSAPAAFSSASRMRCSRSKTPACCHRSGRRRQVCPEPNPGCRGSSCPVMSLWSTYRMPCRHARSATGQAPGDRSGQGGSTGSISVHKPSSTIHGRLLTPSRTAESPHRSRPVRTPPQDRVTSSEEGVGEHGRGDVRHPADSLLAFSPISVPAAASCGDDVPLMHGQPLRNACFIQGPRRRNGGCECSGKTA